MSSGSISFDEAAEYYDRTRITDPEAIRAAVDMLDRELGSLGRILEIGVGTGILALPLAERGREVVGLDLSRAMMRELISKSGGVRPFALVQGDATRLPFADASMGGAYARWVLHLIPDWRSSVGELCRVVGLGGRVLIEADAYGIQCGSLYRRFMDETEHAAPAGLDVRAGYRDLDDAFAASGAAARDLPAIVAKAETSPNRYLDRVTERLYSWTWRIPDDELRDAIERVRRWAAEEYSDMDSPVEPEVRVRWRAYDVA